MYINTRQEETDLTNVHGLTQGIQLFTFGYVQLSSIQYTGCTTVHIHVLFLIKSFLTRTDNSYTLIWQLFDGHGNF